MIAACAGTEAVPEAGDLAGSTSCGDAIFHFENADSTAMLTVNVDDVLKQAAAGRREVVAEIGDGAAATLQTGNELWIAACNDFGSDEYRVDFQWPAVSGTATVTILEVPEGAVLDGCGSTVTARLAVDGLRFETSDGVLEYPELSMEDLIGWCPG
jgi:hypothetical protein